MSGGDRGIDSRLRATRTLRPKSHSAILSNPLFHISGLKYGGEGGIRTLDGLLTHTPLAGARLRPLGHLSVRAQAYRTRYVAANRAKGFSGLTRSVPLLARRFARAVAGPPASKIAPGDFAAGAPSTTRPPLRAGASLPEAIRCGSGWPPPAAAPPQAKACHGPPVSRPGDESPRN